MHAETSQNRERGNDCAEHSGLLRQNGNRIYGTFRSQKGWWSIQ